MLIINLITKHRNKVDANYTTVNWAKEILPRKCDVRAQHIFKEANTIVDWLANFGSMKCPYSKDNWIIDGPTMGLFSILYYDFIEYY
jgi:hypothetical protein